MGNDYRCVDEVVVVDFWFLGWRRGKIRSLLRIHSRAWC